jgi:hypothetical protein
LPSKFSQFDLIVIIFVLLSILVFEIIPTTGLSAATMINKIKKDNTNRHYQNFIFLGKNLEDEHVIIATVATTTAAVFLQDSSPPLRSKDKETNSTHKLVHSSFRLKEAVVKSLEKEAQKRGVSISNLVNKTLQNYLTCEMYFEELGFILVSKDFLRRIFNKLDSKHVEDLGRELGLTVANEYISYFFPEVNTDSLINFLDLWFKRFQSYQHRLENNRHFYVLNHDINMNFCIALKAMLEGLIEPILKCSVNFRELTSTAITFSFTAGK